MAYLFTVFLLVLSYFLFYFILFYFILFIYLFFFFPPSLPFFSLLLFLCFLLSSLLFLCIDLSFSSSTSAFSPVMFTYIFSLYSFLPSSCSVALHVRLISSCLLLASSCPVSFLSCIQALLAFPFFLHTCSSVILYYLLYSTITCTKNRR